MATPRGLGLVRRVAVVYTVAFVLGSVISVRRGYVAEALGIRTGRSVRADVLSGVGGAGLAAPWNMIVQLWVALAFAGLPGRAGRRARAWLAFLSTMFLAGSVAEPVSHRIITRELPPVDATVAVANIVLPGVMLGGALASLVDDRT